LEKRLKSFYTLASVISIVIYVTIKVASHTHVLRTGTKIANQWKVISFRRFFGGESKHGLRYMRLVGDGNSSFF
jgi:hypothetical protein